jgi:hypothetical protein
MLFQEVLPKQPAEPIADNVADDRRANRDDRCR